MDENNALAQPAYTKYPYFTKNVILYIVVIPIVLLLGMTGFMYAYHVMTPTETLKLFLLLVVILFEYVLLVHIPIVRRLRKTGKFLFVNTTDSFVLPTFFYRPLGKEPLGYGAVKVNWSFVKATLIGIAFLFVAVMPTTALIF